MNEPLSLTVSELTQSVADCLTEHFALCWIRGTVSGFTRATSGHCYFVLKDDFAQIRCVMYRHKSSLVLKMPRDGDDILIRAQVSLYAPRGEFQCLVEAIRLAGTSSLAEQFLRLKEKLQREGLFDTERKKPIPAFPRRIGIVTSLQAAALADALTALARRAPYAQVIIYPSAVQGEQAPAQLCAAIQTANQRRECEVLLLIRGGGSIEDLAAFNDEMLARTIASSVLPVVCGVGHETDTTIADWVADLRAPTPTAAAELCAPDLEQCLQRLTQACRHLLLRLHHRQSQWTQQLDRAQLSMQHCIEQYVAQHAKQREGLDGWLKQQHQRCLSRLDQEQQRLRFITENVLARGYSQLREHCNRLNTIEVKIQALSPYAVLSRGYAMLTNRTGVVINNAHQVTPGEDLQVTLATGSLLVNVLSSQPDIDVSTLS